MYMEEKYMLSKILNSFLLIILSLTISNNCANINNSGPNNVGPELVRVNQSYQIDGNEVLDSSLLINEKKQSINKSSLTTSSDSDWNMVSKNLETGIMDFFYFDEKYYSYRQFAFDNETSDTSTARKMTSDNDYIECLEPQKYELSDGSIVLYTEGYDPSSRKLSKDGDVVTNGIIGSDDRVMVSNTNVSPYNKAGLIVSKYNVQNLNTGETVSRYFSSTGFMEGPDLLVTAGHGVYGDVTSGDEKYEDHIFNPRFPDEIYYYPAKNGDVSPYGTATVERVYIEKSFYLNTEKDWACCKLSTKVGNSTGWCGKISYFYEENYPFDTFGYPSSGNGKMYEASAKMTYFEEKENGYYYRTNLDADGGQSGSPYIVSLNGGSYVCGIHTYTSYYVSSGEAAYSGGIRIDGLMFAFMNSFVSGDLLFEITPDDYGFGDYYPIDETHSKQFTTHELDNGIVFRTRRYRTGFIQGEYIVMSPIRPEISKKEAFIEYSFNVPINRIQVDLTYWREVSTEIINKNNGSVYLQIKNGEEWSNKFDLLSDTTNLPTDRNNPTTYTIDFEYPTYVFRFYAEYHGDKFVTDANRGRICIGDMIIWRKFDNYMPINGYELDYEPSKWSDEDILDNHNCYDYALNSMEQVLHHPGGSRGLSDFNIDDYYKRETLIELMGFDAEEYNFDFAPIGKYEQCDPGYYKIAICSDPGYDIHFYRQNSDGTWSHKMGNDYVSNLDSSNQLILDPENCARKYSFLEYNLFYGFFQINISNTNWG